MEYIWNRNDTVEQMLEQSSNGLNQMNVSVTNLQGLLNNWHENLENSGLERDNYILHFQNFERPYLTLCSRLRICSAVSRRKFGELSQKLQEIDTEVIKIYNRETNLVTKEAIARKQEEYSNQKRDLKSVDDYMVSFNLNNEVSETRVLGKLDSLVTKERLFQPLILPQAEFNVSTTL